VKRYGVLLPTPTGEFISVHSYMSVEVVENLRANGYDVYEILTIIPNWVVDVGLLRPWVFCSDVFNFRWKYLFSSRV